MNIIPRQCMDADIDKSWPTYKFRRLSNFNDNSP